MMRRIPQHQQQRKKLLSVVAGVFVFALLLRRAQERADAFMDGWGGMTGGTRGGLNDRVTIAYDLSAATQDEIAELKALEKSLGSAALTVADHSSHDAGVLKESSTRMEKTGETASGDEQGMAEKRGTTSGVGVSSSVLENKRDVSFDSSSLSSSSSDPGVNGGSVAAVAAAVATSTSGSSSSPTLGVEGGGGGGGGAATDCDAVLADKIRTIEKQAQRWQAMVLQRAQAHAAYASAEACQSGRHRVDDDSGAGAGAGGVVAGGVEATTTPAAATMSRSSRTSGRESGKNTRVSSTTAAATSTTFTSGGRVVPSSAFPTTVMPGDSAVTWQREVLGVCVPYRARRDQLEVFASHMRTFLHGQGVPFRIYVGEQTASGAFNRGWALNVAFTFAEPEVDYVVMHDVDMLPLPGVDYRYDPEKDVRHLSTEVSQFDYQLPYDKYCSGVFLAHKEFFRGINGFATQFWGWGGEDDEFCARVAKKKHGGWTAAERAPGGLRRMFGRPDKGRGRFLSMEAGHGGTRRNPHWGNNNRRLSDYLNSPEVVNRDGLTTTGDPRVILKGKVETPLYTVYRSQFPSHLKQPKGGE